uniref:Uncharacterized protein n=1 Tax=viral metagenome TaxID=1070528 RepID=A0A6M3IEY1_9ZZZZ
MKIFGINWRRVFGTVIGIVALFAVMSVLTVSILPQGTADAGRRGIHQQWSHSHNETGVSEAAVKGIFHQPLGQYDLVLFTVNPLTSIAGSGCTIEGGTTSFQVGDATPLFYTQGGVTFTPSSLGFNKVVSIWQTENPAIDGVGGQSGASRIYTYQWDSALSGGTQWKLRVFNSGNSLTQTELCSVSGGSVYVGPGSFGKGTAYDYGMAGASNYWTSSTTFTAVSQIGWDADVKPYFFALGKK